MRKPLVLLSAFLVLTLLAGSAYAARSPLIYSAKSFFSLIRMTMFSFYGDFYELAEDDDPLVVEVGGNILGGDADDFGNGRTDDNRILPGNASKLRAAPSGDWEEPGKPKNSGRKIESLY